jgi:hypothetical protein
VSFASTPAKPELKRGSPGKSMCMQSNIPAGRLVLCH